MPGNDTDPTVVPSEALGFVLAAQRLADLLRRAGAHVTLRWHEAGHGLTAAEVAAARTWLAGVGRS